MIQSSLQIVHKPQELLERVAMWIVTGGHCGYIRIVPAAMGSALGHVVCLPIATSPVLVQLGLARALFGLGIWAPGRAEGVIRTKDSRLIVIDEIIGMWIAVLFLPYRVNYLLGAFFYSACSIS